MAGSKYGFYTGQLEVKPYLSRNEISADCEARLIEDVFRRGQKGYYVIPKEHVESYFRAKGLPESVITRKLSELHLYKPSLA